MLKALPNILRALRRDGVAMNEAGKELLDRERLTASKHSSVFIALRVDVVGGHQFSPIRRFSLEGPLLRFLSLHLANFFKKYLLEIMKKLIHQFPNLIFALLVLCEMFEVMGFILVEISVTKLHFLYLIIMHGSVPFFSELTKH